MTAHQAKEYGLIDRIFTRPARGSSGLTGSPGTAETME